MHAAKEIAQARLEGIVAVRAAKTPGRTEVGESPRAELAVDRLTFGARHLLVNGLQGIVDLWLGRVDGGLHPALGSALLAKMQLLDPAPLNLSELDNRLAFLAQIADHLCNDPGQIVHLLNHDLVNHCLRQPSAL